MSSERVDSEIVQKEIVQKCWIWLQNCPGVWRSLTLVVIYITIAIALEQIAFIFRSSNQVQPWVPSAGWNVVFLFGFGLRYGLAIPFVSAIESVTLRPQQTLFDGTVNGIIIAIFTTGCSALLLYKLNFDPRLYQLRDVVKLAVVAIFCSLAYAVSDIIILQALGKTGGADWSTKIMQQWAGEATGVAMLAPPLLILLRKFPWSDKRLNLQGAAPEINFKLPTFKDTKEWLGLFAATILFAWLAYGGAASPDLDYTYLTFIPLTLICAWKGFESATVIILLINVMAVALVGKNINGSSPLVLQFGLMTVTYVGLLLSAYVTARNKEITKSQDLEEQLRYDATHDSLTGLYNRAWFLDRLKKTQQQADENEDYLFAVLFLDLDRFKTVNDSLGHVAGDRLLAHIADRLQKCLPESIPVARLGGDEFTIIVEGITDISQASQIAEVICQSLRQTYVVDSYEVFITASVGIALSSSDRQEVFNLLRNADIALYEAKTRGKSQYAIFDGQMYDKVVAQAQLEQDLRQAINELNP